MGKRVRGSWKAAALLAVGVAGGAAAVAVATVPGSDGVIHACYFVAATPAGGVLPASGPNLRVIDPGAGQVCSTAGGGITEPRPISWNVTGPQGLRGLRGLPGTATFTYTLVPPIVRSTAPPEADVTIGSGRQEIDFNLLTYGFAAKARGGGTGSGQIHDLNITKVLDKSSAKLLKAVSDGTHFKTVTILVRKLAGGKKHLTIKLTDALITSVQVGSSGNGDRPPLETITLHYASSIFEYK